MRTRSKYPPPRNLPDIHTSINRLHGKLITDSNQESGFTFRVGTNLDQLASNLQITKSTVRYSIEQIDKHKHTIKWKSKQCRIVGTSRQIKLLLSELSFQLIWFPDHLAGGMMCPDWEMKHRGTSRYYGDYQIE